MEILYEADSRREDPQLVLGERRRRYMDDPHEAPRLPSYSQQLVSGVSEHRASIDRAIDDAAIGWSLERMPIVDRNILRIAVYELRHVDDVDVPVAIKEALRVAEHLSSVDDPAFFNAVLDKVAHERGPEEDTASDSDDTGSESS